MIKKLMLLMFITSVVYSQAKVITYKDVPFYADSISQVLSVDKSDLHGLFVPKSLSENYTFQVSPDGTNFYSLVNVDSTLYTITIDSSQASAIPLSEDIFKSWKHFKVLIDNDITDTVNVKAILSGVR